MADLRLTSFAGGQSDIYIDGAPTMAKKLRNCLLDRRGKPFVRPGSEVWGRTPNASAVEGFGTFLRNTTNDYMLYATSAALYYQQISAATTSILEAVLGLGSSVGIQSGGRPVFSFDRNHAYYARAGSSSAGGFFIKAMFPGSSGGTLRPVEGGLPQSPSVIGSFTNAGAGAAARSYNIYVVLKRTYVIDGVTFIDRSIPYLIPSTPTYDSLNNGVSFSNAGVLSDATMTLTVTTGSFLLDSFSNTDVSLSIETYRTNDAGTIPYLVNEETLVTGGTRTVSLSEEFVYDADVSAGEVLYTFAGAVGTGPSPKARYFAVVNEIGWYGHSFQNTHHVTTGAGSTQTYGLNVLHQSVPGDPDGVPEDFFLMFDNEITGVAGIDVHPIVFESDRVWRIEGQRNADGSGDVVKRLISDGIGCVSHNGVVNIGNGLLAFPGKDQFYVTNGFNVRPYSPHLTQTYKAMYRAGNDPLKMRACYVQRERRAYFAIGGNVDSTVNRNFSALCLDVNLSGDIGCFTEIGGEPEDTLTHTGSTTKTLNRPEFIAVGSMPGPYGDVLVRSDAGGYIYWHEEGLTSDPIRDDNSATTSAWIRSPVVMDIITSSWSLGSDETKWFPKSEVAMTNMREIDVDPSQKAIWSGVSFRIGPGVKGAGLFSFGSAFTTTQRQSLYIFLDSDNFSIPRKIVSVSGPTAGVWTLTLDNTSGIPIGTPMLYFISYGPGFMSLDLSTARDNSHDFRAMKVIRKRDLTAIQRTYIASRYHPKGTLRGTYRDLRIRSAYQVLARSDDYAAATVADLGAYGTVTLANPNNWPSLALGQWIHFESDGYARGFRIVGYSALTLEVNSNFGFLPSGSQNWEIRGYAKDERPLIDRVTMTYYTAGQSNEPYTAQEGGGNA